MLQFGRLLLVLDEASFKPRLRPSWVAIVFRASGHGTI